MINFTVKFTDSVVGKVSVWDVSAEGIGSKFFADGLDKAIRTEINDTSIREYTATKWVEEFNEHDPNYLKVEFGYDVVEISDNNKTYFNINGVASAYTLKGIEDV